MSEDSTGRAITLAGRYRLESSIAIGGMGEVWKARDLLLERDVAIKVLKAEYLSDPGFLDRFRAEARHAAGLSHPGIATVYDYGEIDDAPFLVMELVAGEPLSAILARSGALPIGRSLDIAAQTARALGHAHAAGVVHRDVKPANILVGPDGTVKVTDFGIARAIDGVSLTATGTVLGTANYLSPEQASGRTCGPASDLYSLGVVTYEMVAGGRPFPATNPIAVALAHVRDIPEELPPEVPEPVRSLVMRALEKDPDQRHPDAGAFATAAERAARQAGTVVDLPTDAAADDQTQALPVAGFQPTLAMPAAATAIAIAGIGNAGAGIGESGPGSGAPVPVSAESTPGSASLSGSRRRPPRWLAIAGVAALLLVVAMVAEARSRDPAKVPAAKAAASKTSPRPASPRPSVTKASVAPTASSAPASSPASTGPSLVVPADLIGMDYDRAAAAVRAAGLNPVRREVKNNDPEGTVVKVDPDPGDKLAPGAEVTLDTSKGNPGRNKKDGEKDED